MKKAQMESQIFVYILALVIGAGILIYGYSAIKGFQRSADDVLYLELENNIKNDLKTISFESEKVKTYNAPSSVTEICFKARNSNPTESAAYVTQESTRKGKSGNPYVLIQRAMESGTENNVFIYPRGEKAFFAGTQIQFDDSGEIKFKCFDVKNGSLKIRISGQGSYVMVGE